MKLKPGSVCWYEKLGFVAVFVANGGTSVTFLHNDNERHWPLGVPIKLDPGSLFLKPENHVAVWEP